MVFAFNILILLILAGPVLAVFGGSMSWSAHLIAIPAGLIAVSLSSRQVDVRHLAAASQHIRGLMLLVLLVIVAQLLPLPLSWSHPIWTSAAETIPGLNYGHISVDLGRTAQAFISTLAWIAVAFISVAVARDRQRAEWLLTSAGAVTAILSSIALIQNAVSFGATELISRDAALASGEFGIILATALIFLVFEPKEFRRKKMRRLPMGLGGAAAILIHTMSLYLIADVFQWIAAGLGVALLLILLTIRQLALPYWTIGALYATTLLAAGFLIAWVFNRNSAASGLLRFMPMPAADTAVGLDRLIGDGRWLGSGANTFDVLSRIYQSSETPNGIKPQTSAIQILVETGWGGFLLFVLSALVVFAKVFWGALERGRDWIFPATAAASIVVYLYSSLVAAGLVQLPITLLLAVVVGTGLSQGFSQNARS